MEHNAVVVEQLDRSAQVPAPVADVDPRPRYSGAHRLALGLFLSIEVGERALADHLDADLLDRHRERAARAWPPGLEPSPSRSAP